MNETKKAIEKDDCEVYLAEDIQRILGIGRSKSYYFLDEVARAENPPFRVLRVGKLLRVPKQGFDAWLYGTGQNVV